MIYTRSLRSWLPACMCVAVLTKSVTVAAAVVPPDVDMDGVADVLDNCVQAGNMNQRDTDSDGFGNLCDADLNNDGFVNALDLGLFKAVFQGQSPDADLNGDGPINALDLGLFKPLFAHPPGPSNVRPSAALALKPPAVSHADVFTTDHVLPDGNNGAAFYTMDRQAVGADVVAMTIGQRPVNMNDMGIEPDIMPADGTYSGFVKLDTVDLQQNEQAYVQRLGASSNPTVTLYSGHDVSEQRSFSVGSGLSLAAAAAMPAVALDSGIILTPIFLRLGNLVPLASTFPKERSLTITDLSVVADRTRTFDPCDVDNRGDFGDVNGVWSFKTLMTNMANTPLTGITAQQFIHNWLMNWRATQTVAPSPFTIAQRPSLKDFFPPSPGFLMGWDGANAATLDIDNLPFRLLAIVNRMDLAGVALYGQPANVRKSETRFVFGLVDRRSPSCHLGGSTASTLRMTVIFELSDPVSNCVNLQARALEWIALSTQPFPSPQYNAALETLTNLVTTPNAQPRKANGSALDQLRTNEFALGSPWQLREFVLNPPFSSLVSATIKQTPDPATYRTGSTLTGQFMETNADAILCETHQVPESFMGMHFLGTHADYFRTAFWDAPATIVGAFPSCWHSNASSPMAPTKQQEVRHKLALNTCDDCHSGETDTNFTHIDPLRSPATLSGFLTGITVPDPSNGALHVMRTFNDLQRRAQSLEDQALGCLKQPISFAIQQAVSTSTH